MFRGTPCIHWVYRVSHKGSDFRPISYSCYHRRTTMCRIYQSILMKLSIVSKSGFPECVKTISEIFLVAKYFFIWLVWSFSRTMCKMRKKKMEEGGKIRMKWNLHFSLYLYINLACLSVCLFVCLSVCLYPINVKTAEPIGPKFFVGHHVIPGKVYEW